MITESRVLSDVYISSSGKCRSDNQWFLFFQVLWNVLKMGFLLLTIVYNLIKLVLFSFLAYAILWVMFQILF